jgi:mannosyltransferase
MTKQDTDLQNPEPKTTSSSRWPWVSFALLMLILVAATVIRLYRLNAGLWLDEILTYLSYARLPFRGIITSYDSENQHFLYSILAHSSFLVFGESNWALRLPAVLFGVGSILATYLVGKQVSTRLEALLAALLLTFSYHHVWFSQNARGYTGLLFFTLISTWLLLRAFHEGRRYLWILFGVTAALGAYIHLTMLFVVAGQFLACIFWIVKNKIPRELILRSLILGFAVAGILTVLLHAPVLSQMRSVIGGTEVSVVSAWKSPLWTLREFIRGLNVGFTQGFVAFAALLVFSVGLISYWRRIPEFIIIFIMPPIIGGAFTIAIGHHLWPRFFFFAVGFGVLIVIRGTIALTDWASRLFKVPANRSVLVGVLLCGILILFSALSVPFAYGPKQDFVSARDYLLENIQTGDKVVTIGITAFAYHDYLPTNWDTISSLQELDQIRENADRTWVVFTFPEVLKATYPGFLDSVQKNYTLIKKFTGTVGDGDVYIFRMDQPSL